MNLPAGVDGRGSGAADDGIESFEAGAFGAAVRNKENVVERRAMSSALPAINCLIFDGDFGSLRGTRDGAQDLGLVASGGFLQTFGQRDYL